MQRERAGTDIAPAAGMGRPRTAFPRHARVVRSLAAVATVLLLATCRTSPTAPRPPQLEIATTALPAATRGEPYAEAVHAVGGDGAYEWDIIAGQLPAGLTLMVDDLSVDHALISGNPDSVETRTFTVRVRSGDGQSTQRQFTLAVLPEPAPLAVHTRRLPPALAGSPYDVQLRANGGNEQDFAWELVEGALPTGLSLSTGGRITGTPAAPGIATFVIEVHSGPHATREEFDLRVVSSDPSFRITVFPVTDVPAAVRPHVDEAVAQLEAAVIGNLSIVTIPRDFFAPSHCGGFGTQLNGTSTDDIIVILNVIPIDGPGGVLGQAGPCGLRSGSQLPFAGIVTLDADDLAPLAGTETLTDIILHELAHVLGFGSLWPLFGVIEGRGTTDPRFTGSQAVAEYQAIGGTGTVPVEALGGQGTAGSHWRKSVFHIELMTGFAEPVGIDQPLSRVSIASFGDLGYQINLAAADAFALARGGIAAHGAAGHGHDILYDGPVVVLQPDGTGVIIELPR
jgi:hypothetical protein